MHLIEDVFEEKVRKKLIKDSKDVLELRNPESFTDSQKPSSWFCPNLRHDLRFIHPITYLLNIAENITEQDLDCDNAWITYCRGNENFDFHNHEYDYSAVYYMQTEPHSSGTLFEKGLVSTKQNSVLIFDANLKHKVPSYNPLADRRTLVLDINTNLSQEGKE